MNDEVYDLNDKNIQLMNDIGRLKKEVHLKGFLHTPSGSVFPSETVSSVTADSIIWKDSSVTNKVNVSAEGIQLNMTDAVDLNPDSIAVITKESILINEDKGDQGSSDKKVQHDGVGMNILELNENKSDVVVDKIELHSEVLDNDIFNEKNSKGVDDKDQLPSVSIANDVSNENDFMGNVGKVSLSSVSVPKVLSQEKRM